MNWKLIETAPKDGRPLVLYDPVLPFTRTGKCIGTPWTRGCWLVRNKEVSGGRSFIYPSHWKETDAPQ